MTPILSETLAPPITATYGCWGSLSKVSRIRSSFSTKKPIARQSGENCSGHCHHRGFVAVAGAKGVVDVTIGKCGHLLGKGEVAFLFALVEPDVFEDNDAARGAARQQAACASGPTVSLTF